jgi:4-amino-4-deoxy-L-arabinose transferase-like glycosyltransferase
MASVADRERTAVTEPADATRRRRPPSALVALMTVSLLLAVAWASLVPAFQAPDEQSHFNYVQTIGTRFALPGDPARPFFSTQVTQGIAAVNSDQVAAQIEVKPEWDPRVEATWAATEEQAPRDDAGGPGPGSAYPPTAYAWMALGYAGASSGTLFDELLGGRLMSALWLPVTVLGTWLLAGEVFRRRRLLQTAAAAVPALAPMVAFVAGSVSPDGMLYAIWTLCLWLGVRCIRRGVPLGSAAAFFALVGVACTIKPVSYALLPPAALVLILGVLARRPLRFAPVARLGAAAVVPLALTLGAWFVGASLGDRSATTGIGGTAAPAAASGSSAREFLSYLWQYYLPRTPLQTDYNVPPGGYPLLQVWITQGWAAFGWLEVKFTPWVYRILALLTAGAGVTAAVAVWRVRRTIDLRVAGFLALAFAGLLAGLHWTDYHQLESGVRGFMQARYVFPAIGILGLALAAAVSLVRASWRGAVVGGTVAFLLVFHLLSLGLVLQRFYA